MNARYIKEIQEYIKNSSYKAPEQLDVWDFANYIFNICKKAETKSGKKYKIVDKIISAIDQIIPQTNKQISELSKEISDKNELLEEALCISYDARVKLSVAINKIVGN